MATLTEKVEAVMLGAGVGVTYSVLTPPWCSALPLIRRGLETDISRPTPSEAMPAACMAGSQDTLHEVIKTYAGN